MARWKLAVLLGIGVALAAVGGTWAARGVSRNPSDSPATRFRHLHASQLDFGSVWESDQFEWSIAITNSGDTQVDLTGIGGSCDCTTVEPTNLSIPPKGSGTIRLKMDLSPKPCEQASASARMFAVTIRAVATEGSQTGTVTWNVGGTVKRPLHISPVEFGRQSELNKELTPHVVPVRSHIELEDLIVENNSSWYRAAVRRTSAGHELVVTPSTGLTRGVQTGALKLLPVARDGSKLSSVVVPVSLELAPDIEAIPDGLLFGARDIDSDVVELVALRSLTGRPFAIESMESSRPADLTVEAVGSESCRVRIRLRTAGAFSGSIRLHVRPRDGESVVVEVPVSGHVIALDAGGRP